MIARALTQGPGHHFFGYYDKCPWDLSGRYLLDLVVGKVAGSQLEQFVDCRRIGDRILPGVFGQLVGKIRSISRTG